jgi:LytS/YehU family sensor histidine kinase
LLIQPYVENAIWHGLMHKKNGGVINIAVTQSTEQSLLIEISDNGVGRQVAAAYKSKSATRQKSFGMKMTSERISIINQLYKMEADIEIKDIKDDFDNTAGTKVSIKIPV